MKKRRLLLTAGALLALGLTGCSTYRGGTADESEYGTGYGSAAYPAPMASPTFPSAAYPRDLRDPQALTQPQPPNPQPRLSPQTQPRMVPGVTP